MIGLYEKHVWWRNHYLKQPNEKHDFTKNSTSSNILNTILSGQVDSPELVVMSEVHSKLQHSKNLSRSRNTRLPLSCVDFRSCCFGTENKMSSSSSSKRGKGKTSQDGQDEKGSSTSASSSSSNKRAKTNEKAQKKVRRKRSATSAIQKPRESSWFAYFRNGSGRAPFDRKSILALRILAGPFADHFPSACYLPISVLYFTLRSKRYLPNVLARCWWVRVCC